MLILKPQEIARMPALGLLAKRCAAYKQNHATMETNEKIREQIFEIIRNQVKTNKPPETKATYDRLRKQGFDDFQTRQLIGQCVAVELFQILKFGKPFNNERYIKNLVKLPDEPYD